MLVCVSVCAQERQEKQPSKGLLFFYRIGDRVDNFLERDVDTAYIVLPEHSFNVAFTTAMVGINSRLTSNSQTMDVTVPLSLSLYNRTTPSVDLGFNVGYRGFGFGYSWDALHAYARHLNFSFGSKSMGLEYSMKTSRNISTSVAVGEALVPSLTDMRDVVAITNTNLSFWYALNAAHYSHNAAIKQSYIQRRPAGSLLLHLSYMSSQIQLNDSLMVSGGSKPLITSLMSDMCGMTTRQVAVGIGYGINYTPNNGKLLFHVSAAAMLVCYSVNHIQYYLSDAQKAGLPDEALFVLHPAIPVHVTGNVRAAISWEINEWVHLSAWATGDHLRFNSAQTANQNSLSLANWNWKAQLTVGVRFGAGKDRVQRALNYPEHQSIHREHDRFPLWLTDYFWSPK